MQKIEFENDGYDFLISSYTVVGPRLNGMNDKKIFTDEGKYSTKIPNCRQEMDISIGTL